jgi:hypothetical protein
MQMERYFFQQQLNDFCNTIIKNKYLKGTINFFPQHNRHNNIFRGDPNYESGINWYDWANVKWSDDIIPAKLLLFIDIKEEQFVRKFSIGETTIISPGHYAIAYSLKSSSNLQQAHLTSKLVQYGTLDLDKNGDPKMCIFHLDCISSTISAVPYKTSEDTIKAKEWIFLRPKFEWYNIFTSFVSETVNIRNENYTKKRKSIER